MCDRISNTEDYNIITDTKWLEGYLNETIQLVHPLIQQLVARGSMMSPQGYYKLGVWLEKKLQHNLHGMQARLFELQVVEMGQKIQTDTENTKEIKIGKPE